MMHGTREVFDYVECSDCGTVQIVDIPPADVMARHYPKDYYSFNPRGQNGLARWLATQRDRYVLRLSSVGGGLIALTRPEPLLNVLSAAGIAPSQRILDVGCGAGLLLDRLARAGFSALMGADPFIEADSRTPAGVPVQRRYLHEVAGIFDVVMFNHSLEHVADPLKELAEARARLAPGGMCLVRIPTPTSEAWESYRADWVQLDAPRHIVLPSRRGIALMADAARLRLEKTIDDSEAFQFSGSELYRRDIPLRSPQAESALAPDEIERFARRAADLNRQHRGDQALFILHLS
ncbi:MAG: methyltransferase [Rhodocyclaceae bacterium]|nr:methyltransferase [Rhodocyclaceae bacterium]